MRTKDLNDYESVYKELLKAGDVQISYAELVKYVQKLKTNISKIVYYGTIQNVIFNALQQALFGMMFEDYDMEEKQKKVVGVANGMADSILRGLGIGGSAVAVLKNMIIETYDRSQRKNPNYGDVAFRLLDFAPPIDAKVSKLRQAGNILQYEKKKIKREGWSLDNPAYLAAANAISAVTNLPLDRVIKKYNNLAGAVDEDRETWIRVANLLGYPTWQLMTKDQEKKKKAMKKAEQNAEIESLLLNQIENDGEKSVNTGSTPFPRPTNSGSYEDELLQLMQQQAGN